MNIKIAAVAVVTSLVSPFLAAQDAPSYSFAEVGYTSMSFAEADVDGIRLKASFPLSDYFFIAADYSNLSGDFDLTTPSFAYGMKSDFNNGGSFFASYAFSTWDFGSVGDFDVDTLRLGYRHMVNQMFEINGSVTSNDFDGETESGYQLGFAFEINDSMQLVMDYEIINIDVLDFDIDTIDFGFRISF
jgi:hypothetical protein